MRVVEAEFAFQMGRDLPPGGARFSREEIIPAIEGVIPAIEIVDSRFESWTTIGAPSLIADNACNAAWVRGALRKNWHDLDLATQPVRVIVNGQVVREGSGSAVLGHPLNALEWLANSLALRGIGLRAGQCITTGVTHGSLHGRRWRPDHRRFRRSGEGGSGVRVRRFIVPTGTAEWP
jgi:2-keto-4-pentenoate hydratase